MACVFVGLCMSLSRGVYAYVYVCTFTCACEHVSVCVSFGSGLVNRVRRLVVSLCV